MKEKRLIYSYILKYKKCAILTFISIFIANLLALALPWGLKVIIDKAIINKDTLFLTQIVLLLLMCCVVRYYLNFKREYLSAKIGQNVCNDLRNLLFWNIQTTSIEYHDNNSTGTIISKVIGDVDVIKDFMSTGAIEFVYCVFNFLFIYIALFIIDPKITIIISMFLPFFIITYLKFIPRLKDDYTDMRNMYSRVTNDVNEMLGGVRVIKVFQTYEYEHKKFKKKQSALSDLCIKIESLRTLLYSGSEFVSGLGMIIFLWFGGLFVMNGRMTAGELLAFYSYIGMMFYPLMNLTAIYNYYQEAETSIQRIQELLDNSDIQVENGKKMKISNFRGDIVFDKVSFGYNGGEEILKDISFEINPGEKVGIVGLTGSGKSTIINLLIGFYSTFKGNILMDGFNIKDLDHDDLRSKMSIVLQDVFLFDASIKENIAYGNEYMSMDRIINACKLANVHDFISGLPEGYNAMIGERGVKLSAGQRQLLCISRAILNDSSLLIMDEPTSSMDYSSENLVVQGIRNLTKDRTSIIIAHRLSTIYDVDKIIVINDGKLENVGTHKQLLKAGGTYASLYSNKESHCPTRSD